MKTIDERAQTEGYRAMFAASGLDDNVVITQPNGMTFNGLPEYVGNVASQGYKDGATEQREIDIEKACEWFCSKCVQKKEVCRICKSKEYIRKAMMEK